MNLEVGGRRQLSGEIERQLGVVRYEEEPRHFLS
jgi:hypothetical protein